MKWKYGLVLVSVSPEGEEECEMAELYQDKHGNYTSWCKARITSPSEFEWAYKDFFRDGVNRWFYENGTFIKIKSDWDWDYEWKKIELP